MKLIESRKQYNLTQAQAAILVCVPLRTYIRYEKDENYGNQLKEKLAFLFEENCKDKIDFCYLYGSYAKGYAKENNDVDLCVSTSLTGLKYVGLSEAIRNTLHKNIDIVRIKDLNDNIELISEIMRDGIKIYSN